MRYSLVVLAALAMPIAVARADDDINKAEEKLNMAREAYSAALAGIRDDVAKLINDKDATERKRSNPDLSRLKAFKAEKDALEQTGEMPKWIDAKIKDRIAKARAALVAALTATKAAYVRAKDDEKAAAIDVEIEQIKNGAGPAADATKFGTKYFKVFDTNLTWHEAKKQCEQMGGRLAVINSAEENKFVIGLIKKSRVVEAWLGATDEKKEGEWVWVTGKKMTYSNWERTQPNNKGGVEHYLILVLAQNGQWSDQPDKSTQHKPGFVCQWD